MGNIALKEQENIQDVTKDEIETYTVQRIEELGYRPTSEVLNGIRKYFDEDVLLFIAVYKYQDIVLIRKDLFRYFIKSPYYGPILRKNPDIPVYLVIMPNKHFMVVSSNSGRNSNFAAKNHIMHGYVMLYRIDQDILNTLMTRYGLDKKGNYVPVPLSHMDTIIVHTDPNSDYYQKYALL